MAADFTGLIITSAELRAEIGDPSLDPTSETYVSDTDLDNLIDRYEQLAQDTVDERINNMTAEELVSLGLHKQAAVVDTTPASDTDYPNLSTATIDTATYIPIPLRVIDQTTQRELSRDDDLVNTYRATNGLFTPSRYAQDGAKILTLPNNTNTLSVLLVTKAAAENLLEPQIINDINNQIVQAARQMMADRRNTAASFRSENKIEAP